MLSIKILSAVCMYVLQVSAAEKLKCECGKPSDNLMSMRIVGGRRVTPHSYPWAVAIRKNDRMHCGGAVITDRHILSAGHCFKWDDFRDMKVLIGLHDVKKLGDVESRNIKNVVIHEKFTSTAVRDENDIALATLSSPVHFGETIVPVCLPEPGREFEDISATVVGWGRVSVDGGSSQVLLQATLHTLTNQQCKQSALSEHITPTMMCAFSKGKDGCQGDSGGPLVLYQNSGRYEQIGIVSWGIGCADPKYPGIYTKVSYYIDWIAKHTTDGKTCN